MPLRSTSCSIVLAALLGACGQDQRDAVNQTANETTNVVVLPTLPVPAAMDRGGLLAAVAQAASAAAAGVDDGEAQRKLDGQQFQIRLRFGCGGPSEQGEEKVMSWRFDQEKRALRLRAAPDLSKDDPLPGKLAGDAFEAVEGFWVARPWLLQAACPVRPPQPPQPLTADAAKAAGKPVKPADRKPTEEPEPAEKAPADSDLALLEPPAIARHRVGIAQFFSPTDSRTLRRDGRAYEATKVLAADQQPSRDGYDLVLSGRLARLPDGRVIACSADQPDRAPNCIISADFDRVWIERPDTRETLAEWSAGG